MKEQIEKIIDDKIELSLTDSYKTAYISGITLAAEEIESHIMEFILWYAGMERDEIKRAYNRWVTVEKINMKIPEI